MQGMVVNHGGLVTNYGGSVQNFKGKVQNVRGLVQNYEGSVANAEGTVFNQAGDVSNYKGTVQNDSGGTVSNFGGVVGNAKGGKVYNATGAVKNLGGEVQNIRGFVDNYGGTVLNTPSASAREFPAFGLDPTFGGRLAGAGFGTHLGSPPSGHVEHDFYAQAGSGQPALGQLAPVNSSVYNYGGTVYNQPGATRAGFGNLDTLSAHGSTPSAGITRSPLAPGRNLFSRNVATRTL